MKEFLARHASQVVGILSGFDRVLFRGACRQLSISSGLEKILGVERVLLKDFGSWAQGLSSKLKGAVEDVVRSTNVPLLYQRSARESKEDLVRSLLDVRGTATGPICVLSAVEPCQSFEIQRHRPTRSLRLRSVPRKCLHYYFYQLHPRYGLMHVRLQTWLPFTAHVCLNGREWLARQLDAESIGFTKSDNCFTSIDDFARAQELMRQQLRTDWPSMLEGMLKSVHPLHGALFQRAVTPYYWTTYQAEWATDVLFRAGSYLAHCFSQMTRHAIAAMGARDILRFLSKAVTGRLTAQVTGSFKARHEGVRIKHSVNSNSVKAYDKAPNVLRVECTINQPRDLRVWRPKEGDPDGPKSWRVLRKGVADTYRLTQLAERANGRYLDSLSHGCTDDPEPLASAVKKITRPVTLDGRRVRALRPFHADDAALLEAVSQGEYTITGFRNRDILGTIYGDRRRSPSERTRLSARVTRLLRLLRAHGLITRIQRTHRYQVTRRGRRITAFIATARQASLGQLQQALAAA